MPPRLSLADTRDADRPGSPSWRLDGRSEFDDTTTKKSQAMIALAWLRTNVIQRCFGSAGRVGRFGM